jgi:hypothetical protein
MWQQAMQKDVKQINSIEDFIKRNSPDELIRVMEIRDPGSSDVFLRRLYSEIADVVHYLEATADLRKDDKEDRITFDLLLLLRQIGYDASHDTAHRGHPDILIKAKKFVWLGEAKIHSKYEWLMDGLKQLHTRYATGKEDGPGSSSISKFKMPKRLWTNGGHEWKRPERVA